ncbi:sigma-70 family RNA polymerase sigma factor [Pseudoalteromonas sp. SR45-6]|uniref:sigma-70 family RNA polymerase sigma factor n=1 Tax=Pseudoalteromonas sp. SR45-6 TaxID=2760927 RepID=UPI0016001C16|nr:sigma-70 family RNA polymerase sigma factor [Pseudoalteromonas sp. SR45-6]MBB1341721.1 sigma-70 family RNA polymerase sigma factor [Pseudoalteromonas sp. SR45-6]
MNKENLPDLIAKVALRDQQAFRNLYEQTSGKLLSIAYRILNNRDNANEILQEAFVQIWYNANEFRAAKAEPFTWMAAIVRYRCYDRIRSENRRVESKLTTDTNEDEEHFTTNDQATTLLCDIGQQLEDCLNQLEQLQRDSVLMAYYHGFSRDEIAIKLKKPLNTVKSWLKRGLTRLQQCLAQ